MKFNTILQQPGLGLLLLRISIGGLMLTHGINKIKNGVGKIKGMLTAKELPEIMAYGIYLGEVVAPILIIIGFFTRPAAAIVAFTMGVAIYAANGSDLLAVDARGSFKIELALMYLLGSLTLVFSGSGRFGVRKGLGPWD